MRAETTAGRAAVEGDQVTEESSLRAAFCHEAVVYRGLEGFATSIVPFVRDGVAADESVMVVVDRQRIDLLHDHLGVDARHVRFADMDEVGSNPARLIPVWLAFVDEVRDRGRRSRGVGEPVSSRRGREALVECQHHEHLLNSAVAAAERFWLLCPYDADGLSEAVVKAADASHPLVHRNGVCTASTRYEGRPANDVLLADPLRPAPTSAREVEFGARSIARVRRTARHAADAAGMRLDRREDFALAVHELATNSVLHGGGVGTLLVWQDGVDLVGEVRDRGRISSPLVGRIKPKAAGVSGRGLWVVHHLCDLVQVRSSRSGTTVRVRVTVS